MEKKLYDLTFWININSEPQVVENKVKDIIEKEGGEIALIVGAKKRNLAYPINKEIVGYLDTIYFYGSSELAIKLNSELKKNQEILRFLIVKRKNLPKLVSTLKEQNQDELKAEAILANES
ncbi:30S ribosomal protein S6 [bacterium HR35]|nr:30S ribosomal protein S6 [bacterium HR35]